MNNPLVSVLMVTYNRASTLKETIASVLNQTYKNIHFIIVDDGSTDETREIVESFQDDRIEFCSLEKNRHICYATNVGFSKVKGEYMARIDSDDVWYPDKLEKQIEFLENSDKYKICFSWIDLIDENGNSINDKESGLLKLFESDFRGQADALKSFFLIGNSLSHPSVVMKKEVLDKVGGFNPGYMQSHDFDFWIRIAKHYPLYVMPERLLAMRRFYNTEKTDNNSNTSYTNSLRFYNEYVDIRKHYFDDMTDELFIEIFKDEFINKDAATKEEYECEKAFLLCRPVLESKAVPAAGIEKLFELLWNPETKKVLEEKYDFIEKTFYEMTGKNIHYDYFVQQELENLRNQIQAQHNLMLEKDAQINSYKYSTSWKITAPIRKITSLLRK